MRRTKTTAKVVPVTVAAMLDELQDRQRAARADLDAAIIELGKAAMNLNAADLEIIRVAELLGLQVEG